MKTFLVSIAAGMLVFGFSDAAGAKDYCGQRSATLVGIKDWSATLTGKEMRYQVTLVSTHDKMIKDIGGTVEFVGRGMQPLGRFDIKLDHVVAAGGMMKLTFSEPANAVNQRLVSRTKNELHVLACVDSIEFTDGSGMIVN